MQAVMGASAQDVLVDNKDKILLDVLISMHTIDHFSQVMKCHLCCETIIETQNIKAIGGIEESSTSSKQCAGCRRGSQEAQHVLH